MDKKTVGLYIARTGMNVLRIFPVEEKKILFCSFAGKSVNCNPMYFNRYLLKYASEDYEYVWAVNDPEHVFVPEDLRGRIQLVRAGSPSYFREMMTAGIVIYNVGLPSGSLVPKRKGQIWVHTWHGGGAFKIANMGTDLSPVQQKINRIVGKQLDVFLSSNRIFSEKFPAALQVEPSHFYGTGLPRNDLFFRDHSGCREKVCRYFQIPENKKILLFAPTFRGSFYQAEDVDNLDYVPVVRALEERFGGEFVVLERKHHAVKPKLTEGVYHASDYPDMQELLAAADVLITDYSSSMWDFAMTDKPGFLYIPDLARFDQQKDFYTPVSCWPYPYAEDLAGLERLIAGYDPEKAKEKKEAYLALTGCFEQGTACEQLMEILKLSRRSLAE